MKKRRKKSDNCHRKSKSKHRLHSARGAKNTTKGFIQPNATAAHHAQKLSLNAFPIQAFCTPLHLTAQPKPPSRPLVDYVQIRARSQPEKIHRKVPDTMTTIHHRSIASASVESMSHFALKTSPYNGTLHTFGKKDDNIIKRMTKVYLSDKHSKNIKELGMEFPGAPPVTPLPGKK